MAHWAELDDNNNVRRVVVCDADDGADGTLHPPAFLLGEGGIWQRTYYSTPGHNYAGIGFRWDPDRGNFISPQPFPSWALDDDDQWCAPVPQPGDNHVWDEELQEWVPAPL
jgi:hypothetical protein